MNTCDLVLDACVKINKKMSDFAGLKRTDTYFPHNASDELLLEEFSKENRKIVTRDMGFVCLGLSKETEMYYVCKNGDLYKINGKAELVESGFQQKFYDVITFAIHESDAVILP